MASAEMAEYYSSTSPNTVTFETTTEVPSVVTTTKKHRISKIIRKIYTKFIDLGDGYGASGKYTENTHHVYPQILTTHTYVQLGSCGTWIKTENSIGCILINNIQIGISCSRSLEFRSL